MDDFSGCGYSGYYYCACCYWDYLGFLGLFTAIFSFYALTTWTSFSSFDTIFDAFFFFFSSGLSSPPYQSTGFFFFFSFLLALHWSCRHFLLTAIFFSSFDYWLFSLPLFLFFFWFFLFSACTFVLNDSTNSTHINILFCFTFFSFQHWPTDWLHMFAGIAFLCMATALVCIAIRPCNGYMFLVVILLFTWLQPLNLNLVFTTLNTHILILCYFTLLLSTRCCITIHLWYIHSTPLEVIVIESKLAIPCANHL